MQFIKLEKVRNGDYLKNYEITYLNKSGKEKKYEMVSRKDLNSVEDMGRAPVGVSIVAYQDGKLLLLKEFRMSINKTIYNLCAGMIEEGETIEACAVRELYEETGLSVKKILTVLSPSYAAVGISDIKTCIVFVESEGEFQDHTSENESIEAGLYSREEVEQLLKTEEFSSRSQIIAHFFARGITEF